MTTYKVSGAAISDLEDSLAIHGPVIREGEPRAFAAVETTFLHSFEPRPLGNGCLYGPGEVGLRSEVIVPDWIERAQADPEIGRRWDLLSGYALVHEQGHIAISQRYAKRLNGVYRRVTAADCDALDRLVRHAIDPIAAAHARDQTEFDRTDPPRFERYLRRYGYTFGG